MRDGVHEPEAREMLQRYLSLKGTRIRTIVQFKAYARTLSDNPAFLAEIAPMSEGLRKAGCRRNRHIPVGTDRGVFD